MSLETTHELDLLFYPRNIAMVGASPKKGKGWNSGNAYITAAIKQNFQGNIYPVHPKATSILGFRSYSSIREIPGEIDLAIFTIPTMVALQVMEECVAKGVKFVHLLTAGFTETGRPEHAELEEQLVHIAQKGDVRIVGPNCMGLYCPEGGLAWNDDMPNKPGSIGFFSQSGQLASHFIHQSALHGLNFSKAVSFGNACDLQAHDFLEYLAQDQKTEIIGSYLEGLKDGRAFFEAARRITREKPLVIWKGGQTEGGSRATMSHTAAIAGSPRIWEALCKQAGIILVHSMQEAIFTVAALKRMSLPRGTNVAIMGGAGGGSVTMADQAEKEGLRVPHLTEKTIRSLEEFVPLQGNSVKNPLDVFFDRDDHFMRLIRLLSNDSNIDALIYNLHIHWMYRDFGRSALFQYLQNVVNAKDELKKPMLVVLEREGQLELDIMMKEIGEWFHENNIATFPSFEIAAKVLGNLKAYQNYLNAKN